MAPLNMILMLLLLGIVDCLDPRSFLGKGVKNLENLSTHERFSIRKLNLIKTCKRYAEGQRVEFAELSKYIGFADSGAMNLVNLGTAERSAIYTRPKLNFCVPKSLGENVAKTLAKAALKTFPEPSTTMKKKTSDIVKEEKDTPKKKKSKMFANLEKGVTPGKQGPYLNRERKLKPKKSTERKFDLSSFFKTTFVMHPLRRIAIIYLRYKKTNDKILMEIAELMDVKDVTFKGFVNFLIRPKDVIVEGKNLEDQAVNLRKLFLPYHYECTVCNGELYPDAIIKYDEAFDQDLEYLLEDLGLNEIDEISITEFVEGLEREANMEDFDKVANLYKELDIETINELIMFYRIDLEMFGYSPQEFYSYI